MYEPEFEHTYDANDYEDIFRYYSWLGKASVTQEQEASKATKTRSKAKLPNTKLCKQVLQRTSKEAQGVQRNRRQQG
jgi:hypothetical protein